MEPLRSVNELIYSTQSTHSEQGGGTVRRTAREVGLVPCGTLRVDEGPRV